MSDVVGRLRRAPRVLLALAALRLRVVVRALSHPIGATLVLCTAFSQFVPTRVRRRRGLRPRIVWVRSPIITLSYWSRAMQELGFASQTVVTHNYPAYARSMFDIYCNELIAGRRLAWLRDYLVMARMLRSADVFVSFFEGGFLFKTRLWKLEALAIRLAGKRLIVCPYGSDIAVPGCLGPFEAAFIADYPSTIDRAGEVRRRVDWLCARAHFVIRNLQVGYLPRFDILWTQQLAVDTERWASDATASSTDGRNGEVVVVHAPNHRALKGTPALQEAVERLRAEGLQVRLELMERRSNDEVREAVLRCDVVAEQFIGGYALFAIEGMSAGKPVLSNLSWMGRQLRATLEPCPIVDATPESLVDELRRLVTDPALRSRLGRASRAYALDRHSYRAVGEAWAEIFAHVWSGEALTERLSGVGRGDRSREAGVSASA